MAMVKPQIDGAKVWTGKVRASYVHIFQPMQSDNDDREQYSMCIIWPKEDTVMTETFKKAIDAATEKGKADKFNGKAPTNRYKCIHDGDEERETEEYKGMLFMNVKSYNRRPGIVNAKNEFITDPDEFYSGCYCRCSIAFAAYNFNGNKGVSGYLNNIQKICDGEPLGGAVVSAIDDFEALVEEDISFLE